VSGRGSLLRARWRRAPVQEDLPLPEPEGWAGERPYPEAVELRWWQRRLFVLALALVAAALLVATVVSQLRASQERRSADELRDRVTALTVRPASTERRVRLAPNPRSWSAAADATIRFPDPPEMLELYVPVGYAPHGVFAVTIEKVDHGRMLLLQRLVPDSNRDLRFALNSSAFGPGEYRIRLQGYTWRGQRQDVGWVRLVVD
jgi:hypothetical protein